MVKKNLYPLKFTPILQPKIWGGDLLHELLGKKEKSESIGESWEISDVDGFHSVIQNGDFKGLTLHKLISQEKERILGQEVFAAYGEKFPLLIKFLDARVPLSIQVHPDDQWANKLENGHGKTEMWYILHAEKDAGIYLGWKEDMTEKEVKKALSSDNIQDYLQKFVPKKGDVFFVPAKTVHSIGKGVVLAEIQQTSDITYRLYDFKRKEKGELRDLHIDKGLQVMNYNHNPNLKIDYIPVENQMVNVLKEDYFIMKFLSLKGKIDLKTHGDFQVFINISGTTHFEVDGEITTLKSGETLLIPAGMNEYTIHSTSAELLCVKV